MTRFFAWLAVALLPFVVGEVAVRDEKLAIGMGGGLGLDLHIPPILLGMSVDLLISIEMAMAILAVPYNPAMGIAGCGSGNHTHRAAYTHPAARNGLSQGSNLWYKNSDGTWFVAVVIDSAFTSDEVNTIYAGMIDIQNKSCMKFYIYNEADLAGYDYVRIQRGAGQGCYSNYIGRAHVGKQIVNLQPPACSTCGHCIWAGTAAHELLHAIGFDHQQNTPGRDNYVTIMWGNIESGKEHNFQIDDASQYTGFGAPYDYGSVMHYGKNAFTSNGQDTIVVKNGRAIGQRDALSSCDAFKLNKMHGCAASSCTA